ncbi:MAG: hypothetical protein AAGG38_12185 [Planctomycetota bacterium]
MQTCPRQPAARSAAWLAVAAVCLSAAGGGTISAAGAERRAAAESDAAVASLIACLNDAAKTLAGVPAAVIDCHPTAFSLPAAPTRIARPGDQAPTVTPRLHLSRLNLPPPAARS